VGTQSWGYRADEDYYSLRHLQQSLTTNLAKGGNFLLNVGPDEKGLFPAKPTAILQQLGKWFHTVKEAFYACDPASEMTINEAVLLTRKNNNLYVHLTQPPISEAVLLNPIQTLPRNAVILNTGENAETAVDFIPSLWESGKKYLRLKNLPVNSLTDQVIVVRLEFDQLPETADASPDAEFREQLT
jgi:alpha-L-fucosidase